MKPSLVRAKDIFSVWFALLLGLIVIFVTNLSHLNADTWGEKVEVGGWVTSSIVFISCVIIFISYYYERWKWISKWKFTTTHGIQCFFDDDAAIYLLKDVEDATCEMYVRWDTYYEMFKEIPAPHITLRGTTCLFVVPKVFELRTPGYPMRLVYGLASGKFIKVGQGGEPIERTAYIHECSHIHLNRIKGREVPEDEAHEIFRAVKV